MPTIYTVKASRFHGGRDLSTHRTVEAAFAAARRHAGGCWSRAAGFRGRIPAACCCGGPVIVSSDPEETVEIHIDHDGTRLISVMRDRTTPRWINV